MNRRDAFRRIQRNMALFSRDVIGVPLYEYQVEWSDYSLNVVREGRNETVVVEMSRQSGKNETSSQLEAAILAGHGGKGGIIVKTAPTWKPQIVNSKLRLEGHTDRITERMPWLTFRNRVGYIRECGKAQIHFLSADPAANVVGATASLLMEVDEAQDVDKAVFDKRFSPMRASKASPVIFYGTTWSDDTLLERAKNEVLDGRVKGKYYRILPERIALSNPAYGEFVDSETRRLGREHPLIKTQYYLEQLPTAGRILTPQHLGLMVGQHERQDQRNQQRQIVAGLDFAGSDENAGSIEALIAGSSRDSVALTIGELNWIAIAQGVVEPHVKILARYEWVNVHPTSLHSTLYEILWNRWKVNRVHCDETGVGATGTRFLQSALNKGSLEIVVGRTFDSGWNTHTEITSRYLAAVYGSRLLDYVPGFDVVDVAHQEMPDTGDPTRHAWWQRGHAKLESKPMKKFRAVVPESEGHDDLLMSEMLMMDAAHECGAPREVRIL